MSRFRTKQKRTVPYINTSSLPDIIFMILFFFMVTSQLKEINPKIKVNLPTSSESKKLKKQSIRSYIYIGFNNNQKTVIQLNNNIATLNDIPDFIKKEREQLSVENKNNLIVTLKIDKKVPMGIVKDVKNKLRECDALVINYANKEINN